MRKYELMTIFPIDEEKSKKAVEEVRGTLTSFGAEIEEEKLSVTATLLMRLKKKRKDILFFLLLISIQTKLLKSEKHSRFRRIF